MTPCHFYQPLSSVSQERGRLSRLNSRLCALVGFRIVGVNGTSTSLAGAAVIIIRAITRARLVLLDGPLHSRSPTLGLLTRVCSFKVAFVARKRDEQADMAS